MAVKLILVVLVLAVVTSSLAQQTEDQSGGRPDRRTVLRRFRSRNRDNQQSEELKETRRQNPRKLANQEEIINRRKQLLQRNNISRRKNFNRKPVVNQIEDQTTEKTVRIKSPSVEDDIPVEKISNSDRNIIQKVLNKDEEKEEEAVPFSGQSEVRTVSSPSGFRSSNEQIVRISFKKSTTSKPEVEEVTTKRLFRLPLRQNVRQRVVGRPEEATTSRVFLLSQASPALKALLATASDPEEEEETVAAAVEEEGLAEDAKAAIREMHEDNNEEEGVNTRARQRGDRRRIRVSARGRPAPAEKVEDKPRSSNRFRSFPARQGGGAPARGGVRGGVVTARPRQAVTTTSTPPPTTTTTERLQARPTPSTASFFEGFEGFDFPAPIPVRPAPTAVTPSLQEVTEVPRSQFTFQQTVGAQPLPAQQQQQQQQQQQPAFLQQQPVQVQQFAPQQPAQVQQFAPQQSVKIQPFVHHQDVAPVTAPTQAAVNVNRFQPAPASQAPPSSPGQFNSFNLLNSNNFAAFDAQFGGSVPTNPGASQLSSNIFAQPGSRLLQGNDVIVNPTSG